MAVSAKLIKTNAKSVTQLCKTITGLPETNAKPAHIKVYLNELEKRYQKLEDSCKEVDDCQEADEDEPEEAGDESAENKPKEELKPKKKKKEGSCFDTFQAAADAYLTARCKLEQMLQDAGPDHSTLNSTQINQSQEASSAPSFRLPEVNVPIFEGGYEKWPAFRDLFKIFDGLNPSQKLAHLHDRTRGEPHEIVRRFDISDDNFEMAWGALIERYENKRILVTKQVKKLFNLPAIDAETPKSLRCIRSGINDCLGILRSFKVNVDNWDPILLHLSGIKLPEITLNAWEDTLANHKELPTWTQMDKFLADRIERLDTIQDYKKEQPSHSGTNFNLKNAYKGHERSSTKNDCSKCGRDHYVSRCDAFLSMGINERNDFVKSKKLCKICLSSKHHFMACKSSIRCKKCNGKHHPTIHLEVERNRDKAHHSRSCSATILPTALVHLQHCGENFAVRILLDGGAEKSFISSRLQQKLSLPTESYHSQISGLGGSVVTKAKGKCNVMLKSMNSTFYIKIEAIIVPKLTHHLPSQPINTENFKWMNDLSLADPQFHKPGSVDMIIGSDFLPLINKEGVRLVENCIEARDSQFGWYISGKAATEQIQVFNTTIIEEDMSINEQLQKFWNLEEVEDRSYKSEDDRYCEQFYTETTYRGADGKYVVRLPFKQQYPKQIHLGPSKSMAYGQYLRMEKTLEKNPALKEDYNAVLLEYETMKHMELATQVEEDAPKVDTFFLPHHAVVRPDHASTKVRVVFNASKKSKSGFSLNDVLYTGPILQADIVEIITNWRYYQYVFTGDVQKMYRQIWLHKDDRKYQQILFRRSPYEPVAAFQLKTVTFGVNCAPFLAIRTLHQLSKEVETTNPQTAYILKNEIYVDDILCGGHSLEEAKEKQMDLQKILASAGFPMKKITANSTILLNHLSPDDLLHQDFLKFDQNSITKTLGVKWNALTDSFSYDVEELPVLEQISKRKMLSAIAKLFDPLGWISPVVVVAKILMQELWELKTGWDEMVPPLLYVKWTTFVSNLPSLKTVNIPRWVQLSPTFHFQLHGFSDASEKAYCGAVYLRCVSSDSHIYSNLLVAKTRVAPLKKTTIPKLELCGALLLTKLINRIGNNFKYSFQPFYWTDSAIVLGWLHKNPSDLKTFVANRISEILQYSSPAQWQHVRTDDNPADIGSRGCTPQSLKENHKWWYGPSWLQTAQDQWPEPMQFAPVTEEVKIIALTTQTQNFEGIIERFSSLDRCFRCLSYIFRFYNSARRITKLVPNKITITAAEINFVKNRIIYLTQEAFYNKEHKALLQASPINTKSSLLSLNPFLDENKLLRVGGRIQNSGLSYNEMNPIIIPAKSYLAELLIRFTHSILLHAEFHIMIRAIRQSYHVPQLKKLIRKCIRECKPCTLYKHKFQTQLMGQLPRERVQFSLPFTYTGVDFAGPFHMKSSSLRNAKIVKGYAAVFVCFSTKAVHLEVCSDLSTEAFLATFTRFVGRRGLPKTMFSDNGRNFLGASIKLLKEHAVFLKEAEAVLNVKYSLHGFSWSFIPPYSPHMGGLWEAAVKSMKIHLQKLSANTNFTYEEFSTLLVRIEAVLNSRPLSPMSQQPQELAALTPGHFLRGAPLISFPETEPTANIENLPYQKRWERLKLIQHIFAKRWKHEYVTELQRRYKWQTTQYNLKLNDFVIVKEDFLPPTEWKVGRVVKVYEGTDGHTRVADVLTSNGVITRAITKLCYLTYINKN